MGAQVEVRGGFTRLGHQCFDTAYEASDVVVICDAFGKAGRGYVGRCAP